MKKFILLLTFGILFSGITSGQYTINGNLGMGNARLSILENKNILSSVDMKNGEFVFEGKVEKPIAAMLSLSRDNQVLVFLENKAEYTVSLNPEDSSMVVAGGGELQKLHREYEAALKESWKKRDEVRAMAKKADQEGKWMDVRHYRAVIRNINSGADSIENRFFKQNASSVLPAYYVYRNLRNMDYKELKAKYGYLGEAAINSEWGKIVTEHLQKLMKINPGSTAPDFTLATPDGVSVTLHGMKGKIKLIDFWASWCGPCRANNPEMLKLYEEYKDKGLEIIGVSLDTKKEPWEKAVAADGLPWAQVSSLKGWECPVASDYRIASIPTIIVLDGNNRIIQVKPRDSELKELLEERLK